MNSNPTLSEMQAEIADLKSISRALFTMDEYEVQILAPGLALVSKNGAAYRVHSSGSCTCPHYEHRLKGTGAKCKHYHFAEDALKASQPSPEQVKRDRELLWD